MIYSISVMLYVILYKSTNNIKGHKNGFSKNKRC